MNKIIKKILSTSITIMLLCTLLSIVSLASTPPTNSRWAFITSSQREAYSASVTGTYKVFGGDNKKTSKHSMTICSQYYENGKWKFDKKIRVGINQTLNDTNTTFMSSAMEWRVYLKPYSIYLSGCEGQGYIWYDM